MKKFTLPAFMQIKPSLGMRLQAMIWLVMAVFMIVLLILLWMYGKASASTEVQPISDEEKSVARVEAINVSKKIDKLNDLSDYVEPIKFETIVRDLRDYPDEFKDKIYLSDRSDKWTVQVMDVANHEVITDFLDGREDRDKFAYFRFTDQNNKSRYMLTYEEVDSLDEAMEIASVTNFGLPNTVQAAPEEMSRYISMVDNYERAEAVLDMSRNRPRSVSLNPTRREVPVKRTYSNSTSRTKSRPTRTTTKPAATSDSVPNTSTTTNSSPVKPVTEKSLRDSVNASETLNTIEARNSAQQQASTDKSTEASKRSTVQKTNSQPSKPLTTTSSNTVAKSPKTVGELPAPTNQNALTISEERTPKPFVPNSPPN